MESTLIKQKSELEAFWKDKKMLVTGGSAGLGLQLALQAAQLGTHVTVVARDQNRLSKVKEIDQRILTINMDIADKNAVYKIAGQAVGQMLGVDVLINNASSLGVTPLKLFVDTECETLQDVLETNLLGPFRLIKALLPGMIFNKNGLIINISSDAAINAYPRWGSYSVSKAALDHLSRIMHEELKDQGIIFLSIDPGDMYTEMHLAANPTADISQLYKPEAVARDLLQFISRQNYPQVRLSASEWRALL
jgi:short-subunit dehydrogenase